MSMTVVNNTEASISVAISRISEDKVGFTGVCLINCANNSTTNVQASIYKND